MIKNKIKRLVNTNSIIKVYDKKWRLFKIKQILFWVEEIRISIRIGLSCKHYCLDDIVDNKNKDDDDENDNDKLNDSDNNIGGSDNDGNVGGDNDDDNDVNGDKNNNNMNDSGINENDIGGGNKDNNNDVGDGNKDNNNDVGSGNKDNDNDIGGSNKDNDNDIGGSNKDNDIDINIKKDGNGNNNDVVNARKNSLDEPFYLFVSDNIKKGSTISTSSNTSKHSSKTRKRSIFSCHWRLWLVQNKNWHKL
ncbi:hypothetical protein RclHR1_08000007 [Rhizophagus clarus]|uniref:Uncharacterized protein n=1 Tax=Rhizophagus clarus TaxID=94130 RepID=A0A2Z6SE28_9GLOM|nr:hypothetical protein RclHR1_08000007 [Rhizophagus clarus]